MLGGFQRGYSTALLCLSAEIEIVGPKGFRRVPLKDFYTNDGVVRMKLEKNEMLTRIFLPESMSGWQGAYLKLRIRGSIDYPLRAWRLRSRRMAWCRMRRRPLPV